MLFAWCLVAGLMLGAGWFSRQFFRVTAGFRLRQLVESDAVLDFLQLRNRGKPNEALARLLRTIRDAPLLPGGTNLVVETLICAGRHQEALAQTARSPKSPTSEDRENLILVENNQAEAEYNLGKWAEADERMRKIEQPSLEFPITRAGLWTQRAWISVHRGEPEKALELLERAQVSELPTVYRAENYFTEAVVLIGLGQLDDAQAAAEDGKRRAMRISSKRNASFILARVAHARGDLATAEKLCRAAANHAYRTQGGDGLLLWGDVLAKLGRNEEAREAWKLAIARDGESESARLAEQRLAAQGERASQASSPANPVRGL